MYVSVGELGKAVIDNARIGKRNGKVYKSIDMVGDVTWYAELEFSDIVTEDEIKEVMSYVNKSIAKEGYALYKFPYKCSTIQDTI